MTNDTPSATAPPPSWIVYILRCRDGSFYTGITTDLPRRLAEHNSPTGGSKYTRTRRPVTVVYAEAAGSRSEATRRERRIKSLSRNEKQHLVASSALGPWPDTDSPCPLPSG